MQPLENKPCVPQPETACLLQTEPGRKKLVCRLLLHGFSFPPAHTSLVLPGVELESKTALVIKAGEDV